MHSSGVPKYASIDSYFSINNQVRTDAYIHILLYVRIVLQFFFFFLESWVDIASCASPISFHSSDRVTPVPFISSGEEYLRLLKEAQRESNSSSRVLSKESSMKGRFVTYSAFFVLFIAVVV